MKRLNLKLVISLAVSAIVLFAGVYVVHGIQIKRTTEFLKDQADKADENGDLEVAAQKYRDYLQYSGGDADTQVKFALLMAKIAEGPNATAKDYQNAYAALDEILRRNPENEQVRAKLLDYTLAMRRWGESLEHLDKLLATSPNDAKLLTKKAQCQSGMDKDREAVATLKQAIGKDPREVDAYWQMAMLLRHKLKDAEGADRAAEDMVAANSGDVNAYLRHASYLQYKGAPTGSEEAAAITKLRKEDAKKALELKPDNVDAVLLAVNVYREEKDYITPIELLRKALEKNPEDQRLRYALAQSELLGGKPDVALDVARKATQENPNDAQSRILSILLTLDKGDVAGARKEIDELQKLEERGIMPRGTVRYLRARTLVAEKKWLEASRELENIRDSMQPSQQLDIDVVLAACYERLGRPDRRLEAYEHAMSINSGHLGVQTGYALALMNTGKVDEARQRLEAILKGIGIDRFVENPVLRNNLINLLLDYNSRQPKEQRDWKQVNELVEATIKKYPDALEGALLLAEVSARMDDLAAARKTLEAAQEKHPKSAEIWLGLARLVERQTGAVESMKVLDKAEQTLGDTAAIRMARVGLASTGDEAAAKKTLEAAAAGSDKFTAEEQDRLWQVLGVAYYRLKEPEKAKQWWMKVLERNPADLRMHLAVFEISNQAGDDKAMLEQIEQIKKITRGAESPEVYYFQARRLVSQARAKEDGRTKPLDEARRLLKRAAELRPQWAVIARAEAEVDDLQNKRDEAIANLERAVRLGDTDTVVLQRLVELLTTRGRGIEAEPYIKIMKARNPDSENALLISEAEMARQDGNLPKAIELTEKAVEQEPNDPRRRLYLGQLYAEAKRYDEAEQALRQAVEKGSDTPLTWLALIKQLIDTGKPQQAREEMEKLTGKLTEQEALLVKSQGFELLKELTTAEQLLIQARDAKPEDLGLTRVLATFYFRNNRADKAGEELNRLVAAKAASEADQHHLDWARRERARLTSVTDTTHEGVQTALKPLREKKNKSIEDYVTMAGILSQRPDAASRQEAIGILEQLGDKLTVDGRYMLAVLYERVGQWNKCREQMLVLMGDEKQQKRPVHLAHFVELLLKHGEPDLAKQWVEKLEQMQPGEPLTIACKARWLVRTGKKEEGVALLQGLVRQPLPPQLVDRMAQVAKVMEDLELHDAAEKMYRDYTVQVPRNRLLLAEFYGRRGRLKDAMDECENALATAIPEAVAQVALTALRSQQRLAGAEQWARVQTWFDAGLAKKPDSLMLKLQLAEFNDLQGKFADVEKIYRDLLGKPNLQKKEKALVQNNLAFLQAVQGKTGEAPQLIEQAIAVMGPTSDLLDTKGLVLLSLNEPQKAIAELKRALSDQPSGTKWFHLAQAHLKDNDPFAATEAMKKAVNDFDLKLSDVGPLEQPKYRELFKMVEASK